MPLPKLVAAAVVAGVLGAQFVVATPLAPDRSWYWPFLPYPMYAKAHQASDTLAVPQLRVSACGSARPEAIMSASALGAPVQQVTSLLGTIARAPESDQGAHARARLSRALEAEFPARYCTASVWVRTVRIADPSTYDLENPMRRAAVWSVKQADAR
jgi:hypothetical protein